MSVAEEFHDNDCTCHDGRYCAQLVEMLREPRDIHTYFGLTYCNYLVLHRSVLQSMPEEWQQRFVVMLRELDLAVDGLAYDGEKIEPPARYRVQPLDERGRFMKDPVPHYNRGRTVVDLNPLPD